MKFFYVYLYMNTATNLPTLAVGREQEFGNEESYATYDKLVARVKEIFILTNENIVLEWIEDEQRTRYSVEYKNLKDVVGGSKRAIELLESYLYEYDTKNIENAFNLNGFTTEYLHNEIKRVMFDHNVTRERAELQVLYNHEFDCEYKDLIIATMSKLFI